MPVLIAFFRWGLSCSGLDIGELLQDVWGQDWPDHVEDLVDGELRGNGVHQWFPFCRWWFVLCASHQKLACAG